MAVSVSTKQKDTFFQWMRGICICAVVLIHCKGAAETDSVAVQGYYIILRQLINFPVGVFYFMSGYFMRDSSVNRGGGIADG